MYEDVIKSLNARGFCSVYTETADEAKKIALNLIGSASVGFGGSVTIRDLGIYEELQSKGNDVYWHWKVSPEKKSDTLLAASCADFYISSTNALTEDGLLVNTDGHGNRIAAHFYGPRRIIIIAGINKLVPDLAAALKRIKETAAPLNAKRLNYSTPCAITGKCTDCKGKTRICRVTTVMEGPGMNTDKMHVILVGQPMGF